MQSSRAVLSVALVAAASSQADAANANPLGQVVALMNDLSAKVTKEGEAEAKAYKEYFAWCDDVAKNTGFAIKTAESEKEKLEASIAELTADIEAGETKIADHASSIATGQADLSSATSVREKETADFGASEKELLEAIDALGRAVTILEREMQKNPAAFAQVKNNYAGLLQAMSTVVDAASFSSQDKQHLAALVQQVSESDDEDSELGAPAAAAYKTHSSSIFDVLEDLKEKAEGQLSELRKAEVNAKHNYDMLKQSLEDQISADTKDMDAAKNTKASNEEGKSVAQGDLATTEDNLKASKEALASAGSNCMTVAADHEATVASRTEELEVIAKAIKLLQESTGGAEGQTYSLLQTFSSTSASGEDRARLARSEIVALIKKLAREHHSAALAQLASRVAAVVRYNSDAAGPFDKVKGLISDMISKLEAEAASEATEKAYCDDELAKTQAKKDELNVDIAKLTTKIDQAAARSAGLKADVNELQGELATMAKEQADSEAFRQESHANFVTAKSDLTTGLAGVRKALVVLRDYYAAGSAAAASFVQQPMPPMPEAHSAAGGAADSILGILEVVESDFAKNLASEETEEASAAEAFEKSSQEYKLTKTQKEKDVEYKTQEFKGLDKSISELSSDKETENTELSAVLEYDEKLKARCIAKPETYSERKARREAEIEGLKQALDILENETAFVQHKHRAGRRMRGSMAARLA